ncbi:hypothetical protein S7711_04653 [Stachybotrys chartarum IBT 7711]|uniref:Carboxypeptidase n=1 Tax=Stachybotrys chartarum (strain CBS 109288 / IBT 7711) TaxID=1280523 RepID=A0A084B601_STACB|nr:hypothetical protein S7711_04653 [Stachybotrys chartarum IBT 7711]
MQFLRHLAQLTGSLVFAQTFVPAPSGLTEFSSQMFPGAVIEYKNPSICETTPGVKFYSGYVTLPKHLLPDAQGWRDDQAAHLFFWYFEARNDPENAPTSLYLGGGPGASSFDGMSNFPCFINADSNSTTLNQHSWNNHVNMLYIDQPVLTGFSYVTLQNATLNLVTSEVTPVLTGADVPELNVTVRQATLDFGDPDTVPNNTMTALRTLWAFSQVWFNEFPERRTSNSEISLWTVSYGGFYGPSFFEYVQLQNDLIAGHRAVALANATVLELATLGLADACIDARAMALGYPTFSYNNTYGLEVYPLEVYEDVVANITNPETGCYALIDQCRALAEEADASSFGTNPVVNAACGAATQLCYFELQGAYSKAMDRSTYDITLSNITAYPRPYQSAYYNQRWVQEELGVPLNFTRLSQITSAAFFQIGDPMRRSMRSLERVLDSGVNVALMYGDRDYQCNWYGGERISVSLDFSSSKVFRTAGYAPIITNATYQGGLVREHGNLSFSRIFQAGHGVAGYQPETISRLFDRAMFRRDMATGEVELATDEYYATEGPRAVYDVLSELPGPQENVCFLHQAPTTCTREQLVALVDGSAVVRDFIVVEPRGVMASSLDSSNPPSGAGNGSHGEWATGETESVGAAAAGMVRTTTTALALVKVSMLMQAFL